LKDFRVVVADFGMSEVLAEEDQRLTTTWGTINW
jgi:hypothetical protein